MCTLVILRRPGHDWPLIVASNRDENRDRRWTAPGRHWSDRKHVVAGRDELAGGTWLGINDDGLVAGVLNRSGTLGHDPDLRSRGELPLEALDHAEAGVAAQALEGLEPLAYRPFNLFVGDTRQAFWICSVLENGDPGMRAREIPEGVSMLTDNDLNDGASPRIRRYLPKFEAAAAPDPGTDDWAQWRMLLADKEPAPAIGPGGAMNVDIPMATKGAFGTVSSSFIAPPASIGPGRKTRWLFAAGAPDLAIFEPVET